ncbi:MAG: SDR family oxidoreductase [Rhodocyclaceae bacterium]
MNVFICGADGFLGGAIARALAARGHAVTRGVRRRRHDSDVVIDYDCDLDPVCWLPRLSSVDAVVNAVGILRAEEVEAFERVHHRAPAALFQACHRAGVVRGVQISALGAADGGCAYLSSKAHGDAAFRRWLHDGVVIRPGLVFAAGGVSASLFLTLASFPVIVEPRGCPVQPVHVDDLVQLVVLAIEGEPVAAATSDVQRASPSATAAIRAAVLDLPGPRALPFGDLLACYRASLGFAPAWRLRAPAWLFAAVSRLSGRWSSALLDRDTWAMLAAGNVGDPAPAQRLLGRALVDPVQFVPPDRAEAMRLRALAAWRGPMLRGVLATIWLLTAWVSLCVWPWDDSLAMLAAFGLVGGVGIVFLVGAGLLDLVMGGLTLLLPGRRLWVAQLGLIGGYSALIAWGLPAFLYHPFGPVLKNLAVATLLVQLLAEDAA